MVYVPVPNVLVNKHVATFLIEDAVKINGLSRGRIAAIIVFSDNNLECYVQIDCTDHAAKVSKVHLPSMSVRYSTHIQSRERDVAQSIACPPLKRSVVGSILLSGPSCSLGYFPFQPVVHNWFTKGRGMYFSVWKSAYKRSLAAYRK